MKNVDEFLRSGLVRPEGTILEVGAHVGDYAAGLRQLFPGATIIAFEPDPRNIFAFKGAGRHKMVTLVEAAAGDRDGTATLHLSSGCHPDAGMRKRAGGTWTQSSSLKAPLGHLEQYPWVRFERTASVRVVRLDSYCREQGIGEIDLIWADVQGAEGELIAGAQETLRRTRYFLTEYSDTMLYEGQITSAQILERLPGAWEVVARFDGDVLLRNTAMA